MPFWACGHHRSTFSRTLQEASDERLRAWAAEYPANPGSWGEQVANEIRRRRSRCPACAAQRRSNVQHWSALGLAIVLALLVACAAATGSCSGGCP